MKFEIVQTEAFSAWLRELRDLRARAVIARRLARLSDGNFGDWKSVGGGVSELRIDYGPGYRAYIAERGEARVILLCGGDKSSQERDIRRAKTLAAEI